MKDKTNTRILLVEDEPKVAAFIRKGLEVQGYTIEVAVDGQKGKTVFKSQPFDLVILDVNLPFLNGFELCKLIREENTQIPILMLTALGTTGNKLTGFEAGADDYLVKPFEFLELLARVKALVKRSVRTGVEDTILQVADLQLDLRGKVARRKGKEIELTAREYMLLEFLMRNQGRVLSRIDLAEHVWEINFDTGTNIIDVYVNYLRKKIDKDADTKLIHTVIGMGYMMKSK
jgi:DNA-binding response OmpR family regulator